MAMVRERIADALGRVFGDPQRRRFSAAYKARIVQEAEACTECGQVGRVAAP